MKRTLSFLLLCIAFSLAKAKDATPQIQPPPVKLELKFDRYLSFYFEVIDKTTDEMAWEVCYFQFTITAPKQFEGQKLLIHHDGLIGAGNPFKLINSKHRYTVSANSDYIGIGAEKSLCSINCDIQPIK
jgi:hypothetical protein